MFKIAFHEPDSQLLHLDNLKLYSITRINNIPGWCYKHHSHPNFSEISFIETGNAKYTLGAQEYIVQAGDMILISKNLVHAESMLENCPLSFWTFSFSGVSFYAENDDQLIPQGMCPVIPTGDMAPYFMERFKTLYQEQLELQIHSAELSKFIVCDILLHLSRLLRSLSYQTQHSETDTLPDKIKCYIDEHYQDDITLNSLARSFYVSTYYISHEMKKKFGLSPINYLINRRIGEAQRLLLSTDLTVTEIAERIGYDNIYYFTNIFKKRVGCAPALFRQMYQNGQATDAPPQ